MTKRNKKQARRKQTIKKRNLRRVARKSNPPAGDQGFSLAAAGAQDIHDVLMWSEELADAPEFKTLTFDPAECMEAFGRHSQALGLDAADDLPHDELEEKQADLMLAIIGDVLTPKHQKEIMRRLKRTHKRFEKEEAFESAQRVQILISLLDFAKDKRVFGTLGFVNVLVTRNLQAIMLLAATAEDIKSMSPEVSTYAEMSETIEQHPQRDQLVSMFENNPAMGQFFRQKVDHSWDAGMAALENGDLSLRLFDEADYEAINGFLDDVKGDADTDEMDEEKLSAFIEALTSLVKEKIKSADFLARVATRLEEIIAQESIPAEYMPFAFSLRSSLKMPEWIEESAEPVLVYALLADLRSE